jgi:hypothetical protein
MRRRLECRRLLQEKHWRLGAGEAVDALFLEFLRWKEQQSAANSNAAAESLRGTISP